MDEFDRRPAETRAMNALAPEEIHEALGIAGQTGVFEIVGEVPWTDAVLDTSADLPEINRLAEQVASGLDEATPAEVKVWARHGAVVIESGARNQSWTDMNDLRRHGVDRAGLVQIALQHAQDELTEVLAWPWPGETSEFPEPFVREAGGQIESGYGPADEPVLRFVPIAL
jgi:hypothetical protein